MMKINEILRRLKSPVVIIQLITIVGSVAVTLLPQESEQISQLVYAITVIVNVFAGINNPADSNNF